MKNVSDLKPALYELLQAACDVDPSRELAVSQQMGVQLTPSMKKDGVNIIQIQNVKMEMIVPKLIDLMKMVDELCIVYPPQQEVIDLPMQALAAPDPFDEVCKTLYEKQTELREAEAQFRLRYFDHVTGIEGSRTKAAKFLGTSTGAYYSAQKTLEGGNGDGDGKNGDKSTRLLASATDIG